MRKKVLIVRFSAFGDLVLTTGPLAQLRKQCSNLQVDLLTSEIGEELFINSLDVDNTIVVPKGSGFRQLRSIYKTMDRYDVVIDWQDNLKTYLLRFYQKADFFKIKKQSKERRAFVRKRKFKDELNKHVVEKYYDTLIKAFEELHPKRLEELRPMFLPRSLTFNTNEFDPKGAIALHPYASQKNKEWPYFVELCKKLVKQKRPVIVLGSSEVELDFPKDGKYFWNLTNKTSIPEMASFISSAEAFVTTDSGPMHLGVAMKVPTIALFGPTTQEFGFYPSFDGVSVLEEELECRPCHVHGGNTCPLGHHACMEQISVNRVLQTVEDIKS